MEVEVWQCLESHKFGIKALEWSLRTGSYYMVLTKKKEFESILKSSWWQKLVLSGSDREKIRDQRN